MRERYTAGYLGAVFAENVPSEQEAVIAMNNGAEPDRWFVDTGEGRPEFKALIAEVSAGRVHEVVMRHRGVLPHSTALNGEFFDALMETETELTCVEQGTTNPTEKFMAQILPLLHEWDNGESAFMAAHGWFTIHAGLTDVRWLRELLAGSDSEQAKRWLERLLPDVSKYPTS